MFELPSDAGRSWWLHEALAAEPGEPAPPLSGDISADVVILGGGYTGLWTAYHLTELDPGVRRSRSWNRTYAAEGRAGETEGSSTAGGRGCPHCAEQVGDANALRMCLAGEQSVDAIGRFCSDHEVDAWFRKDGDLSAASSEAQVGEWGDTIIAADRLGIGGDFIVLSKEEVRARVDSPTFRGGVFTHHGATVQPARSRTGPSTRSRWSEGSASSRARR